MLVFFQLLHYVTWKMNFQKSDIKFLILVTKIYLYLVKSLTKLNKTSTLTTGKSGNSDL